MTGFNNMQQFGAPDYTGLFLATVKDNNDPEQRQRVKVSIPRLLEGNVADLPWVSPILDAPFGMTSDSGVMNVPALGALVVVQFQNGDLNYGVIAGSIHSQQHTPNAALLLNYPKRRGWRDIAGNLFWIDTTAGSVEVHYQHPSGTTIHINNAGEVEVTNTTKVTVNTAEAYVNASTKVDVTAPNTNVIGNLNVTGVTTLVGNVAASGGTFTHNTKNVGAAHIHSGVQSGGSTTGAPV